VTRDPDFDAVVNLCARSGVALVFVPEAPGTRATARDLSVRAADCIAPGIVVGSLQREEILGWGTGQRPQPLARFRR
jgi:hypothetical protein